MQCPAKDCLKAYHPECARRYKVFMGFGYSSPPYWRIYCEDHAELEIKQRLDNYPTVYYEKAIRFARQINKQADQFGLKPPPFDPELRRVSSRSLSVSKRVPKAVRDAKLFDFFYNSYLQNNSGLKDRFTIVLLKDPSDGFTVKEVIIPADPTTDPTTLALQPPQTPAPKTTRLRKRRPKKLSRSKTHARSQPRNNGKFYSENSAKKNTKADTHISETKGDIIEDELERAMPVPQSLDNGTVSDRNQNGDEAERDNYPEYE